MDWLDIFNNINLENKVSALRNGMYNELMTYIKMKLKAKRNRRHPQLRVGDNEHIYQKRKIFDKRAGFQIDQRNLYMYIYIMV